MSQPLNIDGWALLPRLRLLIVLDTQTRIIAPNVETLLSGRSFIVFTCLPVLALTASLASAR
jgi:hypothetical protein